MLKGSIMKVLKQIAMTTLIAGLVIGEEVPINFQDTIMALFPESGAPTFYEKESELVLETAYRHWERTSEWHPDLDEADVYHARLQHKSLEERWWEMGIGKGGQIYSVYSTFGEAMAPSSPGSQWNDEVWQFTTIYGRLLGLDLPDSLDDGSRMKFANAFVHQSGIYTKEKGAKPFYSPMFATHHDPERRAYSVVSWGQIPSPSINRSGVMIYNQYRDLGAGVIEVTYIIYNFENEPMSNLSPWGGVRTSTFPEHVVSNPDGTYRLFIPWSYPGQIYFEDTAGWAAATQNADDPKSHSMGVVFGRELDKEGKHRGKPRYDCGNSRHGKRDYTVQATVIEIDDEPYTPHLLRMYFVLGPLDRVAEKCTILADYAHYTPLDFTEANVPLVPLYLKPIGQDKVLSREGSGDPVCQLYAWPVKGSRPLFVIKNNVTGRHFMTTDPYAQCEREPFHNPLEPDHVSHAKYKGRFVYHAYRQKTEWVELLGYVMPKDNADHERYGYMVLSGSSPDVSFDPGEKLTADELMVRRN